MEAVQCYPIIAMFEIKELLRDIRGCSVGMDMARKIWVAGYIGDMQVGVWC